MDKKVQNRFVDILKKVTGDKPRSTRRSSGGRRLILKALNKIDSPYSSQLNKLHLFNVEKLKNQMKMNKLASEPTSDGRNLPMIPRVLRISATTL